MISLIILRNYFKNIIGKYSDVRNDFAKQCVEKIKKLI